MSRLSAVVLSVACSVGFLVSTTYEPLPEYVVIWREAAEKPPGDLCLDELTDSLGLNLLYEECPGLGVDEAPKTILRAKLVISKADAVDMMYWKLNGGTADFAAVFEAKPIVVAYGENNE